MRQLVTAFMATVLLCTGTAWASHIHLAAPHGAPDNIASSAGGDELPDASAHCGHAGGHYLGLLVAEAATPRLAVTDARGEREYFLRGRTLEPPTRPPNA